MAVNKAIITGNLTRNSELRATASGTPVLEFSVAVNDRRKNQRTGEWEDYANFVDCAMFGKRAESLEKHLTKGLKVCVEGRLRWSAWEKDGERRSKLSVIAEEIEFMARGERREENDGGGLYEEDVPF